VWLFYDVAFFLLPFAIVNKDVEQHTVFVYKNIEAYPANEAYSLQCAMDFDTFIDFFDVFGVLKISLITFDITM
jgi:hypothetical protein